MGIALDGATVAMLTPTKATAAQITLREDIEKSSNPGSDDELSHGEAEPKLNASMLPVTKIPMGKPGRRFPVARRIGLGGASIGEVAVDGAQRERALRQAKTGPQCEAD